MAEPVKKTAAITPEYEKISEIRRLSMARATTNPVAGVTPVAPVTKTKSKSKPNKRKVFLGIILAILTLGGLIFGGAKIVQSVKANGGPSVNPIGNSGGNTVTPVNPNAPGGTQDPNGGGTQGEMTEAEAQAACESKIESLLTAKFMAGGKTLSNIEILAINRLDGTVYYSADISGIPGRMFCEANLGVTNINNNRELHDEIKNKNDIVLTEAPSPMLSTQVTPESYNEFLNKIVRDNGFKEALASAGVDAPISTNWWGVGTFNARVYDNQTFELVIPDFNGNKSIRLLVSANIPPQNTSPQSKVNVTNNLEKNYTIVETKDFATFDNEGQVSSFYQ